MSTTDWQLVLGCGAVVVVVLRCVVVVGRRRDPVVALLVSTQRAFVFDVALTGVKVTMASDPIPATPISEIRRVADLSDRRAWNLDPGLIDETLRARCDMGRDGVRAKSRNPGTPERFQTSFGLGESHSPSGFEQILGCPVDEWLLSIATYLKEGEMGKSGLGKGPNLFQHGAGIVAAWDL